MLSRLMFAGEQSRQPSFFDCSLPLDLHLDFSALPSKCRHTDSARRVGSLFLFIQALLNPHLFRLTQGIPTSGVQKTLTLVAKAISAISFGGVSPKLLRSSFSIKDGAIVVAFTHTFVFLDLKAVGNEGQRYYGYRRESVRQISKTLYTLVVCPSPLGQYIFLTCPWNS